MTIDPLIYYQYQTRDVGRMSNECSQPDDALLVLHLANEQVGPLQGLEALQHQASIRLRQAREDALVHRARLSSSDSIRHADHRHVVLNL